MSDHRTTGEWTADSIVNAMLDEQKENPAWSEAELWGIERDIVPSLRLRINSALGVARETYMSARRSSDMGWQRADDYKKQLLAAVEALRSIAANSCCDKCQEAALVAKRSLTQIAESATR